MPSEQNGPFSLPNGVWKSGAPLPSPVVNRPLFLLPQDYIYTFGTLSKYGFVL